MNMTGFSREYEGDLQTLYRARRDVTDVLSQRGLDEATEELAALIVSELCSNAIQNSAGRPYTVRLVVVDDDHIAITVTNHPSGRLPPARETWRPKSELSLKELSLRGRGLAIVDSLSEELTIAQLGDELVVTARIRTAVRA